MLRRKPVFDAARAEGADFSKPGNIQILDNALTFLGFKREDEMRSISQRGIDLIKHAEGLSLKAYLDTGGVPTIGVGHTGPDVKMGMAITEAQADAFLREDLATAEDAVRRLFPITTQNQFDALVSFTFNLGEGQVRESTLRRLHNEGDHEGARKQFARWVLDDGKRLRGLERRRAAEAALYGAES
jgi:lysozyme